jgi:polyphosphate kinase
MDSHYINRELSLLDFQDRVLAIAENPNTPILERAKFVAIVSSNLDEFFQVRIAGLRDQVFAGITQPSPDGLTPKQQLEKTRERCDALLVRMERVTTNEILPGLAEFGIRFVSWDGLDEKHRAEAEAIFEQDLYPVLTPLAFDPAHPFPFISNLSLNLAVTVRNPKTRQSQFARVKMPPLLPRFIRLSGDQFLPVEQLVAARLDALFPGMQITSHHPFRVTRSAEAAIEEEEADDLLEAMRQMLHTRHRFSRVVRLEVDSSMSPKILDLLTSRLGLDSSGVYVSNCMLALSGLWSVYGLDRPELKHETWIPPTQPALADLEDETVFDRISERDLLVHFPYSSFGSSVGAFISEAARDEQVVAIKQTLYRTSDPDDPALGGEESIVESLMTAARSGKQVAVLVELKARFEEEANINWARMLEEAGVHVAYGVTGLKTHAKLALVVRREAGRLVRYSHIGTGNYNPKTARLYEDLGLFTTDEALGADLIELFNVLTGYSRQKKYRKLLVAPTALRKQIRDRIRRQADTPGGSILWKLNHLVDPKIIDELYRASRKGTQIDLVVRGNCSILPGVPGLSENIRVRSIVGKYLEHSRIMRFGSGDDVEYLIGSADMMQRNLNNRVETMAPIEDPELCQRLEEVLQICLADDSLAWELHPDGSWTKVPTVLGLNTQSRLEALALSRSQGAKPDPAKAAEVSSVTVASGGVVNRPGDGGETEVLVVHRPAHDDWSFPKGKLLDGESDAEAALREVLEETGLHCKLGTQIGAIEYADGAGRKIVRYWSMEPTEGKFAANDEVDQARWLPIGQALSMLSHVRDRALLRRFVQMGGK